MVLREGTHLTAQEFLHLYQLVKYQNTGAFQGRGVKFLTTPKRMTGIGSFKSTFFFISKLIWELLEISRVVFQEVVFPVNRENWRLRTSKCPC